MPRRARFRLRRQPVPRNRATKSRVERAATFQSPDSNHFAVGHGQPNGTFMSLKMNSVLTLVPTQSAYRPGVSWRALFFGAQAVLLREQRTRAYPDLRRKFFYQNRCCTSGIEGTVAVTFRAGASFFIGGHHLLIAPRCSSSRGFFKTI